MNIDFIDMLDGYKAENDELLQSMEDALMQIQEEGMNDDTINAVFRAAHTIKGSSGMFGINYVVEFTHVVENLLDKIRNHKIEINDEIIDTLFICKDQMQTLVDFVMQDPEGDPSSDILDKSKELINKLTLYIDDMNVNTDSEEVKEDKIQNHEISIDFHKDTFSHGFDPYTFINYLNEIGEVKNVETIHNDIPLIDVLEPTSCCLKFKINLQTKESEDTILEAFEFVKDDSIISIKKIDAMLKQEPKAESKPEPQSEPEPKELSNIKQDTPQTKTKATKKNTAVKTVNSIRVDADKVDSLINLVGEMVISTATIMQEATLTQNSDLIESVSVVSRMLEEVRENAMKIRMVPIGDTFKKYKRIVHDTATKLGKDIDLKITGGDTELDKTVVEKISDPLVHLIRNAVDHGVETPEIRSKAGKNAQGVLELNAYHDAGAIAIEIIDDGNGLDEEVLLQKGIEKGLINEGDELTQKEIFALILQPGFSTAKEVSDISGRGVGMDVVQRNIKDLRGEIEIDSQKGKGTKITIRIPLTLAIIDGFLTKVADTHFIIPLDMIVECIELNESFKEQMRGNNHINLRGKTLPLLNTSEYFNINCTKEAKRDNVVVVNYAGKKMGIVVHELLGELQTVIKPMGKVFKKLNSFSGSTILGSGEVALIMDIPILMKKMENNSKKEMAV